MKLLLAAVFVGLCHIVYGTEHPYAYFISSKEINPLELKTFDYSSPTYINNEAAMARDIGIVWQSRFDFSSADDNHYNAVYVVSFTSLGNKWKFEDLAQRMKDRTEKDKVLIVLVETTSNDEHSYGYYSFLNVMRSYQWTANLRWVCYRTLYIESTINDTGELTWVHEGECNGAGTTAVP